MTPPTEEEIALDEFVRRRGSSGLEAEMVKTSILHTALRNCHPDTSRNFTPAFAPGRILHVTVESEVERAW